MMKERLIELVPDAKLFLDIDDLDTGKGAEYCDQSTVVLVFATTAYFKSANCMRELLRAVVLERKIITMLEPDGRRGGLTPDAIFEQLMESPTRFIGWGLDKDFYEWKRLDRSNSLPTKMPSPKQMHDALFKSPILISEWQRSKEFQDVVFKQIVQALLRNPSDVSGKSDKELRVAAEAKPFALPAPRLGCKFHFYYSENNKGAKELIAELQDCLVKDARRLKREPSQMLKYTFEMEMLGDFARDDNNKEQDKIEEGSRACEAMLLLLNSHTWTDSVQSGALACEVGKAMNLGVNFIIAHEVPDLTDFEKSIPDSAISDAEKPKACSFEQVVSGTPQILRDAGIYNSIAIPMKSGVYRKSSLLKLLEHISMNPRRNDDCLNFVPLETLQRAQLEGRVASDKKALSKLEPRQRSSRLSLISPGDASGSARSFRRRNSFSQSPTQKGSPFHPRVRKKLFDGIEPPVGLFDDSGIRRAAPNLAASYESGPKRRPSPPRSSVVSKSSLLAERRAARCAKQAAASAHSKAGSQRAAPSLKGGDECPLPSINPQVLRKRRRNPLPANLTIRSTRVHPMPSDSAQKYVVSDASLKVQDV